MTEIKNDKAESELLVLLEFYADWCEPCKMLDPILDEVYELMHSRLIIKKIDIESFPELRAQYQIHSVPVLILQRNGKTIWRMNGFLTSHELVSIFNGFFQKDVSTNDL